MEISDLAAKTAVLGFWR